MAEMLQSVGSLVHTAETTVRLGMDSVRYKLLVRCSPVIQTAEMIPVILLLHIYIPFAIEHFRPRAPLEFVLFHWFS
eukprot:c33348_g1_i1 orf=2-229(-)